MIKGIFFDFDGVLVESTDIKTVAFTQLFLPEGPAIAEQVTKYHLNNAGVSRYDKFRYIYREIIKRPLPEDEFQRLCSRFSSLVMDAVINAPFVKGAKEFLDRHSASLDLFVISATPQDELEIILQKRSMAGYFKSVYGAPLPKNDAVARLLAERKLLPQDTVYVGDAMSDLHAAQANSVNFVARVHPNESLFDLVDCVKINDLSELDGVASALNLTLQIEKQLAKENNP